MDSSNCADNGHAPQSAPDTAVGWLTPPIYAHLCRLIAQPSAAGPISPGAQVVPQDARRTLCALLRVNKDLYEIASPYLYRRVTLTTTNAAGLLEGLVLRRRLRSGPSDGRRQVSAKLKPGRQVQPTQTIVAFEEAKWPEESADSDSGSDEDEPNDPDSAKMVEDGVDGVSKRGGSSTPSQTSHDRKLKLLGYVKHLTIASVPVTRFAMRIVMTFLHPRDASPEAQKVGTIFKSCTHLRISGRASWYLAEWSNRHRSRSHPFTRALLDIVKPAHLCLSHVAITPSRRDRWLDARIDRERTPRSPEKLEDVKSRWWSFCHWYNQVGLSNLLQMWELQSMDVHHVVDASVPPPRSGVVRVWYDTCPCSWDACGDFEDERLMAQEPEGSAEEDTEGDASDGMEMDGEDEGDEDMDENEEDNASDTSSTSMLDPGISPETCDQHITILGRSADMCAMLGGRGTRLKREQGESIGQVSKWEMVDSWRTASVLEAMEEEDDAAVVAKNTSSGNVAEADDGTDKIDQWTEETLAAIKADVKAGILDKAVLDKVRLVSSDQAECCVVCGGQ